MIVLPLLAASSHFPHIHIHYTHPSDLELNWKQMQKCRTLFLLYYWRLEKIGKNCNNENVCWNTVSLHIMNSLYVQSLIRIKRFVFQSFHSSLSIFFSIFFYFVYSLGWLSFVRRLQRSVYFAFVQFIIITLLQFNVSPNVNMIALLLAFLMNYLNSIY